MDFKVYVFALTNAITIFVVVVNTILTTLTVKLIEWIGYDTHSEKMTKITNGIFVAQFFNTGLIYLLVYANFEETLPFLGGIFKGPYYDYEPGWYRQVGGALIIYTALLNSVFPVIMQWVADVQKWLFKSMDQGFSKDVYKTKTTQICQYINLYQGDNYVVNFKYSSLLTTCYVTMMYGVGMPILFPISLFAFVLFWAHERYHMAYTYQLPPAFDDKMSNNFLNMLKYAPLLLLLNGYWMLSNKQIFGNVINFQDTTISLMLTSHTLITINEMTQASPLLFVGLAMTLIGFICWLTGKELSFFTQYDLDVDENLPMFFKAVKLSEADWLLQEDKYYQETYKMDLIDDEMSEKLDNISIPKSPIQGIHWYNVLANPEYAQMFSYISLSTLDRNSLIVDDDSDEDNDCEQSDMVALILNLAYIHDGIRKELEFKAGISKQVKDKMRAVNLMAGKLGLAGLGKVGGFSIGKIN